MWAKIKTALNSTLGKKCFNPLDTIMEIDKYHNFYREMYIASVFSIIFNGVNLGDLPTPLIKTTIDINGTKELPDINNAVYNAIRWNADQVWVIAPWVETLGENSLGYQDNTPSSGLYPRGTVFLPPSLKKIKDFAIFDTTYALHIPESVKEISSQAFSNATYDTEIYIHNREGAIKGAPWGNRVPENIIYLEG